MMDVAARKEDVRKGLITLRKEAETLIDRVDKASLMLEKVQTEEEARQYDKYILDMLDEGFEIIQF